MNTRTLVTILSLAALQDSFAAVAWIPNGPATVTGTFADATAANAGGWEVNGGGTYAHNAGAGAQGSTGYGVLTDLNGLSTTPTVINASTNTGRTNIFPTGGYAVLTSVFLDPALGAGSGFNYAVAISQSAPANAHLRDFVTSIGYDGTNFQFSANNGTNFTQIDALNPAFNPVSLGALTAGWYDLQTVFYDNGGLLSADLNLLSSSGTTLATRTIANTDPIAGVGGHRYSWMANVSTPGGNQIGIDSYTIQNITIVPEPGAALLSGLAGFMFMRRRRA